MDPKARYIQLGRLVETMPNLHTHADRETLLWLGRVSALIDTSGDISEIVPFRAAMDATINESNSFLQNKAVLTLTSILYRQLAKAEMNAPAETQGSFIPAGNAFDAIAAVAKVLQQAKSDVLIVDPYMDEKALVEFALLAAEGISIHLLSDHKSCKPSLKPASERWKHQYQTTRPLELRLAKARTLHDRLIIVDSATIWILTQSLNALAARSPASIVRVEHEAASVKLDAYKAIWDDSDPI
jgi:hypothetical protein